MKPIEQFTQVTVHRRQYRYRFCNRCRGERNKHYLRTKVEDLAVSAGAGHPLDLYPIDVPSTRIGS